MTTTPSTGRILGAGLLAGLVLNLIDVPNSALVVSPSWTAVLASQGITADGPRIGAYFTTLHFAFGVLLMLLTSWLLPRFTPGRAAAAATLALLATQRGFGFGSVVMGQMPLTIWLQFSWSMLLGTCLGAAAGVRVLTAGRGLRDASGPVSGAPAGGRS